METLYKFHGGIVAYLTFLTQIKVEVLDVGDGDFLHGNVRQLVFLLQELYHPLLGQFVAGIGLLRGSLADLLCILFIVLGEVTDECFLLSSNPRNAFLIFPAVRNRPRSSCVCSAW